MRFWIILREYCYKDMTAIIKNISSWRKALCAIALILVASLSAVATEPHHYSDKVLFIGDSMTGWLAERLNAYGEKNGFEVATVVWDGSTINKWGNTPKLAKIVKEQDPDVVFISLGMNELFENNPSRFKDEIDNIRAAIGNRKIVWVGPPTWPGYDKGKVLNDWLENELGESSFFRSSGLKLPRQSAKNPHPTRQGMVEWMDAIVKWLPEHSDANLNLEHKPEGAHMSRGKTFIYKRMKESL